MHSSLAAHQSPILETLVQGKFKEATDGFVEWDDIDQRTFTSFWQFAYTGDYDTPEPISTIASSVGFNLKDSQDQTESTASVDSPPDEEPVLAEVEPVAEETGYGDWGAFTITTNPPKKKAQSKRKIPKRKILWNDFQESWRVDLSGHVKEKAQEEPKAHADIFVHHAKVYVLGDRYGITALMEVSFDKLHRALVDYAVSESRLNGTVELLRYCYTEFSPDRLKGLVVHYAACKVKTLWKSVEFQQLLEEHGNMSRALVELLLLRLD